MNKVQLIKKIKKELKNIGYFDIFSVVNITISELQKEIVATKKVNIPNFGKFSLNTFKPKIIKNVRDGEIKLTKAYTALRFTISKNIIKYLKESKDEKNAISKV